MVDNSGIGSDSRTLHAVYGQLSSSRGGMTNAQARVEDDVAMLHKVFQGDFGSKEYFDAMNVWNEACGSITRSLDAIIHKMQEEVAALAHTSGDASDAATQVGSVVRGLPI